MAGRYPSLYYYPIMLEWIGYCLIGIAAGILSGLMGIGGASLMIPALVVLYGYDQKLAQGTTLLLMVPPIGLLAALEYHKAGYTNIKAAIIIAAFFFIGGLLGSKLAVKMDSAVLRKVFAVFFMVIAIRMFLD